MAMKSRQDTERQCRELMARHAKAIWARFEESRADASEAFVMVVERPDGGADIRLEERCIVADALREKGSANADTIDFVEMRPGEIMVMIVPTGEIGALVAPMGKEQTKFDGTA